MALWFTLERYAASWGVRIALQSQINAPSLVSKRMAAVSEGSQTHASG